MALKATMATETFNKKLGKILDEIAGKYNLSADELKQTYITTNTPVKRGRRKKISNEYVEMTEFEYNDEKFLIDDKNTIYTFEPNSPLVIGEKLIDGTVKFNKNREGAPVFSK